jgi:hypothetical protein
VCVNSLGYQVSERAELVGVALDGVVALLVGLLERGDGALELAERGVEAGGAGLLRLFEGLGV